LQLLSVPGTEKRARVRARASTLVLFPYDAIYVIEKIPAQCGQGLRLLQLRIY